MTDELLSGERAGVLQRLRKAYHAFRADDVTRTDAGYEVGGVGGGEALFDPLALLEEAGKGKDGLSGKAAGGRDMMREQFLMPMDRGLRYQLCQAMAADPTLGGALDIHLHHALSVSRETGNIITYEATDPAYADLADELNRDLAPVINDRLLNWGRTMATFGVGYVRPHGQDGRGLTHIESDYYTLPSHIREYERAGELVGYTSQYLLEESQSGLQLLKPPWSLVGFKMPTWTPNINMQPRNHGSYAADWGRELSERRPRETQDYGTSILESAFGPWCDLMESLLSLKASRRNASRIDRFVGVGMGDLDPARASEYLNLVAKQLRNDSEVHAEMSRKRGMVATIWNSLVPVLSGAKGGLTVDTQTSSADIQHIEDIMFHARRLGSAVGIDLSMLGWSDLLSGGLGEGGYLRTSIQSAIRADWIRKGATGGINRLTDIHLAYKYRKALPAGVNRPIRPVFHSMSSAIEREEMEARTGRVDFATAVTSLLGLMTEQLGKHPVAQEFVLTDILRLEEGTAQELLKEIAGAVEEQGQSEWMESVGGKDELVAIFEEVLRGPQFVNQGDKTSG